jgi:hypothetical protein
MRRLGSVALPLGVILSVNPANASPKAISDAEVESRLAFLEARLNQGSKTATLWWNVWFYGWESLTMAQFTWAITTKDKGTRTDMAIGAAASTLGVIPLGILPFPAKTAPQDLAKFTANTPEERRKKLIFAEHLLHTAADNEILRRSWVNHALSISVSIGVGLVLGVGYERPIPGLFNAIGGIALSELQIFTQPTAAIKDLHDYQRFGINTAQSTKQKSPGLSFNISPHTGGFSFSGQF